MFKNFFMVFGLCGFLSFSVYAHEKESEWKKLPAILVAGAAGYLLYKSRDNPYMIAAVGTSTVLFMYLNKFICPKTGTLGCTCGNK